MKPKYEPRTCPICGKQFIPNSPRQITDKAKCAQKRVKRYQQKYRLEKAEKIKKLNHSYYLTKTKKKREAAKRGRKGSQTDSK